MGCWPSILKGWTSDPALPRHTIYAPLEGPAGEKLQVLLWSEPGCSGNGLVFEKFNTNIASYGFIVLANGAPSGNFTTTSKDTTAAIDFIVNATGNGAYGIFSAVDSSKIAAAGQSCGGLEALDQRSEDRVSHIGVFNSGFVPLTDVGNLPNETTQVDPEAAASIRKPTFFFLGGSTDVAYPNVSLQSKVRSESQSLTYGTPGHEGLRGSSDGRACCSA
jgi:hypothetical protein